MLSTHLHAVRVSTDDAMWLVQFTWDLVGGREILYSGRWMNSPCTSNCQNGMSTGHICTFTTCSWPLKSKAKTFEHKQKKTDHQECLLNLHIVFLHAFCSYHETNQTKPCWVIVLQLSQRLGRCFESYIESNDTFKRSSKRLPSPFSLLSLFLSLHSVKFLFSFFQKRVMYYIIIWIITARHIILQKKEKFDVKQSKVW